MPDSEFASAVVEEDFAGANVDGAAVIDVAGGDAGVAVAVPVGDACDLEVAGSGEGDGREETAIAIVQVEVSLIEAGAQADLARNED